MPDEKKGTMLLLTRREENKKLRESKPQWVNKDVQKGQRTLKHTVSEVPVPSGKERPKIERPSSTSSLPNGILPKVKNPLDIPKKMLDIVCKQSFSSFIILTLNVWCLCLHSLLTTLSFLQTPSFYNQSVVEA